MRSGRTAAEHEAEQAVGEELRLAGAGGGTDEGGDRGVGGGELVGVGLVAGGEGGGEHAGGDYDGWTSLVMVDRRGGGLKGTLALRPHPPVDRLRIRTYRWRT